MRTRHRQQRRTRIGLIGPLAMFAVLCGVIGMAITTRGPAGDDASHDAAEPGDQDNRPEAIERALEYLDRAAAALAERSYDSGMEYIDQAREVLRQANSTGGTLEPGGDI